MAVENSPIPICSEESRVAGEPLFATAPHTHIWLLLEYPDAPGKKVLEESALPALVKNHLATTLKTIPASRLLLIRQKPRQAGAIKFFLGVADEKQPRLYEFQLQEYEDLTHFDFEGMIAGKPSFQAYLREKPLFLVCTNSRRDPCCARWGAPYYQSLARAGGDLVWQCSHMGGHRFAPNVICLPHGIYYGHLNSSDATAFLNAYQDGELYLSNYRGRAIYSQPAQAAEYYLREHVNENRLEAFSLIDETEIAPSTWEIRFQNEQTIYFIQVERYPMEMKILESCSSQEPITPHQYVLSQFKELPGS